MGSTKNVAVIVGSLRKASLNRKMAHALMALAPGMAPLTRIRFLSAMIFTTRRFCTVRISLPM